MEAQLLDQPVDNILIISQYLYFFNFVMFDWDWLTVLIF